jgi:hypothetical protein
VQTIPEEVAEGFGTDEDEENLLEGEDTSHSQPQSPGRGADVWEDSQEAAPPAEAVPEGAAGEEEGGEETPRRQEVSERCCGPCEAGLQQL